MPDAPNAMTEVEPLLSVAEVMEIVQWSRAQIFREEQAGRFPKRFLIGRNTVRWEKKDIVEWIAMRKAVSGAA